MLPPLIQLLELCRKLLTLPVIAVQTLLELRRNHASVPWALILLLILMLKVKRLVDRDQSGQIKDISRW